MSRAIRVGDVCVGQNFTHNTERNGQECIVVGELKERSWWCDDGSDGVSVCWRIEWADGKGGLCPPDNIRLKRPKDWDRFIYDTSHIQQERSKEAV